MTETVLSSARASTRQIVALAPHDAIPLWPKIEAFIKAPLDRTAHGRYEPVDILISVLQSQRILWLSIDARAVEAAVVTEIHVYPRKRACNVFLVGGRNMKAWLKPMMATLEDYARRQGCDFMEGGARAGWARAAGYAVTGVTLMKEL